MSNSVEKISGHASLSQQRLALAGMRRHSLAGYCKTLVSRFDKLRANAELLKSSRVTSFVLSLSHHE
jgi:hypothetical protein